MADEINVGRLVAEIIIEGKTEGAKEAEEELEYIRSILEKLGVTGAEADKILSEAFADTSGLKSYRNSLDVLAAKIDIQRKRFRSLKKQ